MLIHLSIFGMIMSHQPREMVRYFADFLSQIAGLTANIKKRVYELLELQLVVAAPTPIRHHMSAVVLATNRAFDDLRTIDSLLQGLTKSKQIVSKLPISSKTERSASKRNRHKLMEQSEKEGVDQGGDLETKTIKRGSPQEIKEEMERSAASEEQTCKGGDKIREKPMNSPSQCNSTTNLEQKVQALIRSNRLALTGVLQTNNECLRLVRSAQKDTARS